MSSSLFFPIVFYASIPSTTTVTSTIFPSNRHLGNVKVAHAFIFFEWKPTTVKRLKGTRVDAPLYLSNLLQWECVMSVFRFVEHRLEIRLESNTVFPLRCETPEVTNARKPTCFESWKRIGRSDCSGSLEWSLLCNCLAELLRSIDGILSRNLWLIAVSFVRIPC